MLLRSFIFVFLAISTLNAQAGRGGRGQGTSSQGTQPPPATDCAASGTVVNSITGEPIAKAMVTMGGADSAGSATDSTGRWSISNTACGVRFPIATRAGFFPPNQLSTGAARQRIELASGSPVRDVKIPLMPEASISGTVRDTDGDPVDSVQIRAMRVTMQSGKRVLTNTGGITADSTGSFRMARLMPGRYIVCADSAARTFPVGGGEALVFAESCFPAPASSGISSAMPVEAGRDVRTSLTLTAIRGVHIRGSVSGASNSASGPAPVVQLINNQGMGGGHSAQVLPDGTFDIAGIAPGSYVARVNLRSNQPGPMPTAQLAVEVGNSDVNDVSLVVQPLGSVSGTVRMELTAQPQSAGANPTAAAGDGSGATPSPTINVNLAPPLGGIGVVGPIPQATWDPSHLNFDFPGVPGGQFRLMVNTRGAAGAYYVKSVKLRGQDVADEPFTVDGPTEPVEVVISDDTGNVDVTVNDADGRPVAASVMLVTATGRRTMLNSGDDGHASSQNIPTGDYRAWAFDNLNIVPYAEDEWMRQNAGPGETVTVTSGGSANVTLKRIKGPAE